MLERRRLMVTVSAAILAWEDEPPGARPFEIQRYRDVRPTIYGEALRGAEHSELPRGYPHRYQAIANTTAEKLVAALRSSNPQDDFNMHTATVQ